MACVNTNLDAIADSTASAARDTVGSALEYVTETSIKLAHRRSDENVLWNPTTQRYELVKLAVEPILSLTPDLPHVMG